MGYFRCFDSVNKILGRGWEKGALCTFEMGGWRGGGGGGEVRGRVHLLFPTSGYLGHIPIKAEKTEWSGKSASQIVSSFSEKVKGDTFQRVIYSLGLCKDDF